MGCINHQKWVVYCFTHIMSGTPSELFIHLFPAKLVSAAVGLAVSSPIRERRNQLRSWKSTAGGSCLWEESGACFPIISKNISWTQKVQLFSFSLGFLFLIFSGNTTGESSQARNRRFERQFLVGGLEHDMLCIYWEVHHPNWRTHISQRGRAQPPVRFGYSMTWVKDASC